MKASSAVSVAAAAALAVLERPAGSASGRSNVPLSNEQADKESAQQAIRPFSIPRR